MNIRAIIGLVLMLYSNGITYAQSMPANTVSPMHIQNNIEIGKEVYRTSKVITVDNDIIGEGADVQFISAKLIQIKGGFKTMPGSTFVAKTQDVSEARDEPFAENIMTLPNQSGVSLYPNPALSVINVSFVLQKEGEMVFAVSNLLGQTVMTVVNKNVTAGNQIIPFLVNDLKPGIYLFSIKTENAFRQIKFIKK